MFTHSRNYIIELDETTYLMSGDQIRIIPDMKNVSGDVYYISDMRSAISRTTTMEAPFKYTDVMVRRQLQDSGEFDEPISVVAHWKKKKGRNVSDIFFTALPTRTLYIYYEKIKAYDDTVMFFPLYAVLLSILRKLKPTEPTAVVFQHSRFADVLIGNDTRVYFANRCVSFDDSEEQLAALWHTVRSDITAAEIEHSIEVNRVVKLLWFDSKAIPEWTVDDDGQQALKRMDAGEVVLFEDREYRLPFLSALKALSASEGIAPRVEKTLYHARRLAPYLSAAVCFILIALLAGTFWFSHRIETAQVELERYETRQASIRQVLQRKIPHVDYEDTVSLIRDLAYSQTVPSFKTVVNDVSGALSEGMRITDITVKYADDGAVIITLRGTASIPFKQAYVGYQTFGRVLEHKGYTLDESRFDTQISDSEFYMKLRKKV